MDIQFIAGVVTIIASMYGMLKFMLKDTHKEIELLQKEQDEFREEMKIIHNKFDLVDYKFAQTQNRLDGLYRVLLDRTYGKNIPEELK